MVHSVPREAYSRCTREQELGMFSTWYISSKHLHLCDTASHYQYNTLLKVERRKQANYYRRQHNQDP